MTAAPTISTQRLTLRHHRLEDFTPLYDLFASERARFMTDPIPPSETWYWVAAEVGSWSLQGFGSWGIERTDDDAFIGQIGVNKPPHFPEHEIGWVLLAPFEGQGYAFEAAQAVLDWYWDQPIASTLVSYITPGNTRSETLATRLGAAHDPNAHLPDGETAEETHVYRHARPQ